VGCGQGRWLRACLDLGARADDLVGVDVRADAIDEARALSPHLDFRLGHGIDLDFPDGSFDLAMQFVVFSSVFFAQMRARLAAEMMRILKPGGYIFWWDLTQTVAESAPEPLHPRALFPGLGYQELRVGMRQKPSACVQLPKRRVRGLGRLLRLLD